MSICPMSEIWKDILGYEGLYQVSSLGRVRSLDRVHRTAHNGNYIQKGEMIKTQINRKGYEKVSLMKNKVRKTMSVHRLVATAFIPNPDNKPQVDHINGDKLNNNADNLRWVTNKENKNNPTTLAVFKSTRPRGKNHYFSRPVEQLTLDGEYIQYFDSITQAADTFEKSWPANIKAACDGKYHTAYGYKWRWA